MLCGQNTEIGVKLARVRGSRRSVTREMGGWDTGLPEARRDCRRKNLWLWGDAFPTATPGNPSTSTEFSQNSTIQTTGRQTVTFALKCSAIRLHSVVLPELRGPNIKILHGGIGMGGRRQGRGFSENTFNVSSEERQYILPRKLKADRKSKHLDTSRAGWTGRLREAYRPHAKIRWPRIDVPVL